ncbi:MAG: phosphatase domain-containing protein [Cyanobacteria bacterium P01_C01_bin.120]
MKDWLQALSQITSSIDHCIDKARGQIAHALGIADPIRILPYWGYGTPQKLLVKGRVLKDEGVKLKEKEPSLIENVWNMYKRFATDEVPNARVKVDLGELHQKVATNKEGFFELEFQVDLDLEHEQLWLPVKLSLLNSDTSEDDTLNKAEVMVVREKARFGVISDIDDTIVHTAATDLLKMIRIVYLGNAESRRPFEGVAEFYQALQKGKEQENNPIFYVSSSAWNMYDVFAQFMTLNKIPKGPLFLKDIELDLVTLFSFDHEAHKVEQIQPIFARFPTLPFILIGDSGQKDAEIYVNLAKQHPERILGILIRDVVPNNAKRQEELKELAKAIASTTTQFFIFRETQEAIAFAAQQGWILEEDILFKN